MAQYTKKAIRQSFLELLDQRPFDKISVVDIAERCEINRNTFYDYYSDIYALLEAVIAEDILQMTKAASASNSWESSMLSLASFLRSNKKAAYHLYHHIDRGWLEQHLFDATHRAMCDYIRKEADGLSVPEKDIADLATYYSCSLLGLLCLWMNGGMKSDTDAYILNVSRLMDGNLRRTLERSSQGASDSAG